MVRKKAPGYQTQYDRAYGISPILDTLGAATQIFVHHLASLGSVAELTATLPGSEKYPERSLVMARPDDLVCVLDRVDDHYLQFLAHLAIGPKPENIIVASNSIDRSVNGDLADALMNNQEALCSFRTRISTNKKVVLNPYMVSPKEIALVGVLDQVLGTQVRLFGGNADIVVYANRKPNVRRIALELGVPVPEGDVVELDLQGDGRPRDVSPIRAAIDRYARKTGRVIIKGSHGHSGSSTIVVENNPSSIQEALNTIAARTDNRTYLVEAMLDIIVSPNILIHIEPGVGRILCVGITDQILDENLRHRGNIYPSNAKTLKHMLHSAHRISAWLQGRGYGGFAGFDFVEYLNKTTGQFEHFLAEINPRTNAAVYPRFLMEHLHRVQGRHGGPPINAFLLVEHTTSARSFTDLRSGYGHLFFDPDKGNGLVPYNTGCLEKGIVMLAMFGESRAEVLHMGSTVIPVSESRLIPLELGARLAAG